MEDAAQVRQSRLGIRTSFSFGPERVTHVISDRSGTHEFSVPYEALDFDELTSLSLPSAKPTMYLWAAGFPIGFFALRVGYDHAVLGAALGIIGFACIFVGILAKDFKWFTIRLDLLPAMTGGARLRILRDAQAETILERLRNEQRRVLRAKYAAIDPLADRERERGRFDWLLAKGVIDEQEHRAAMAVLGDELPAVPMKAALN